VILEDLESMMMMSWGMYGTPHPVVGGEVEVRQRHGRSCCQLWLMRE
jgi:hypothetical protein